MPSLRCVALVVMVAVFVSGSLAQISFSPTWGSGKRSSSLGLDNDCWGKSDLKILYDIVRIIQKQSESLARCMSQTEREAAAMLRH